ncbi:MAG: alginate lyase family protein [Rhodospirillaceae bacterium]|jgi:hypothetical protein|nr:alginate lyase family protein [Rhodospirillaceae bacterium]MBT5079993.1 alginate lyase family protein [Rhodospirillaceae bacterium]MBT5526015.1 alginate lyase family protein [Rhodospirillaceae bacterium]MBT5881804.1 alginate lyase family protein [Rhodospirillaceae bacterium]MBT6592307.1 alginate lyase family protein [Rhodospirillaceae bacterium]
MAQHSGDNDEITGGLAKVTWLANRLASMSPSEIAFRCNEQFKRSVSRRVLPNFARAVTGPLDAMPEIPGMLERLHSFAEHGTGIEPLHRDWRRIGEQMRRGRFKALGITWPDRAGPPLWHLDPSTKTSWPDQTYCFDIAYRYAPERGDVKLVFELNRLQYLQPIAAAAALGNDKDLASVVVRHIDSWISANPPFRGVNWVSGIELALRVVSLLVVVTLIGDKTKLSAFTAEFRQRLHSCLAAHGYWLARFPSRFSSANNHRIAEAGALYMLGRLVPSLRNAKAWARNGKRVLEEELSLQFHNDGVGAEQSPTYSAFTLEWLLLGAVIGDRVGDKWSNASWHRMVQAGNHLRALTDCNGHQPLIGDDDESRVLYSRPGPEPYVNTVMGYLSTAARRPDLAPPKVEPHLGHAFFGKPEPSPRSTYDYAAFPAGGYTSVRDWREGVENLWVMDHGPLGYLSIAAHGHADALAIWLHIAGRPVLVDGGTYTYSSDVTWREHFRSTVAHNTLTIGGVSSSLSTGAFNWSERAECYLLNSVEDKEHWLIEAEHDGYEAHFGYRHRRRLERIGDDGVQLTDSLHGEGVPEQIEIGFLVAPDLDIHRTADGWQIMEQDKRLLSIAHTGRLHGWVEQALEKPKRGWHSPIFGERLPAQRLIFTGRMGAGDEAIFNLSTRF